MAGDAGGHGAGGGWEVEAGGLEEASVLWRAAKLKVFKEATDSCVGCSVCGCVLVAGTVTKVLIPPQDTFLET